MYKKQKPFVFAGVSDVTECTTVKEVLNKASLNFKVDVGPVALNLNTETVNVPGYYSTYRTDTNEPLGVVKGRYTPVQNIDMFDFLDECAKDKVIEFDTAGCLDRGNKCFIAARVPQLTIVGADDAVENYIVLFNSHDGTSGFKIMYTPVRMVCFNKLNSAIRNSEEYFTFKHTKNITDKMRYAKELIRMSIQKIQDSEVIFDRMFNVKIKDSQVEELFSKIVLTEEEIKNVKETGHTLKEVIDKNYMAITDAEISTRKANMLYQINEYYNIGLGQSKIQGTVWGAYNAVSGYCCNCTNIEGEKRMNSLMFGESSNKIREAYKECLELI